jgi:hypothetical protein
MLCPKNLPVPFMFIQYTARLYLCERFALPVARQHASLEAEATG